MKNLLILLSILLSATSGLLAQSVSQGMRFQALARDLQGNLLAKEKLEVKVELYASEPEEKVFYAEGHHIQSNELGLLDFVIGEGANFGGDFSRIPWAEQKMWVRISVKTLHDEDYQLISSGQLYSVPYALYSNTAGALADGGAGNDTTSGNNRGQSIDQTSIYWTLDGNYNSHAVKPYGPAVLGTKDRKDLTMITNNIPRLIIDKEGNINILFDVNFEGNLTVGGNTTLNGSLDVTGMQPTNLTGTLDVVKATNLNDALSVTTMAPTQLTGDLKVGQGMKVLGATTIDNSLNVGNLATHLSGTLVADKETVVNGLTVTGMSPTQLTGTLDVDRTMNVDGSTTLNRALTVTGGNATHLTGIFSVAKTAILNATLTVTHAKPTHLTGTLEVDGASSIGGDFTLNGKLDVANMQPTTMSGTLAVDKLTTTNAGLQVNGGGSVGPGNEYLAYFNNTEGGSGDGIAIKLANEQVDKQTNFMTFYRGANTVAGRIEGYDFGDIADIPVPTTDEIWSAVCVGIADYNPLTIVWTQAATGFNLFAGLWNNTTIPAFDIPDIPPFTITDVPALTIPNVPAFVITDVPGFNIPDIPGVVLPDVPGLTIGPLLCTNICFCPCGIDITEWECCCEDVCLIPGSFTVWPAITIPDFPGIAIPDFPGIEVPDFPGIDVPDFPGIAVPDFPGLVIPAVPEINLAEVFGECPTIPTFSDILISEGICPDEDIFDLNDGYVRRLAEWAFENRLQSVVSADPLKLLGNAIAWGLTTSVMHNGVVYGSKGADYAEYLPKMYASEQFMKGEVVGVYNGKISKNTLHADQILAITSQPLVLGNMQDEDIIADFEQVAFLGQIPVFVNGPVYAGDYIVASGKNDGMAIAVKAENITAEMLSIVLGTAWETHASDGVALVNTSIGLRPMEIAEVVKKQDVLENSLQEKVETHQTGSAQLTSDIELIKRAVYHP